MVQLREFTLEDYDQVYRLWENAGPGLGIGRSDSRQEVTKKLEHDPDLFLVAEENSHLIGTVIGGFDGRRGLVYHLAVEAAYRGHGIGKMLMQEIERRLAAKGCIRCYLLVEPDVPEVIGFYEDLGWQVMPIHALGKNIA